MLHQTRPPARDWLKALLLNSVLFLGFGALYFIPGLGQALLTVQSLMFGLPFIATYLVLCLIQQLIVPHPPSSGMRWTLLSAAFGLIGTAVVFVLVAGLASLAAPDSDSAVGATLATALCAAVFGAIVGVGQWLAIAHRAWLHAWWIAISAVGYLLVSLLLLQALPLLTTAP